MDINIKLEAFEGPFDLLYHLIEKNQINIYDIPISELTDQYLEYINEINNTNLEITSEFLVMAATLIEIKSKMLLPKVKSEETEEELDPREELMNKLIEYKKFKALAEEFNDLQSESVKMLFKEYDASLDIIKNDKEDVNMDNVLEGISLADILIAFEEVMKRKEKKVDRVRSKFDSIQKDLYTIEDKNDYLLDLLELFPEIKFQDIFRNDTDKIEIVVTFLALLELIKMKKVAIFQEKIFGNITIKKML
jgi:segregation and condensation protein A